MGKGRQNEKRNGQEKKETIRRISNEELLHVCQTIWNKFESYEAFRADNKEFQDVTVLIYNSEFMKKQTSVCFHKYGMNRKYQEPKDLLPLATFHLVQNLFKFDRNEYTLGSMATAVKRCLYDEMRDSFDVFPSWNDLSSYAEAFDFAMHSCSKSASLELANDFLQKLQKYGSLKSDLVLDTPEQLVERLALMTTTMENGLYMLACQWSTPKYQVQMEEMSLDDEENGLCNTLSDATKDMEELLWQREQLKDILDELQNETSSLRVLAFLLVKGGEMAPRHLAQLLLENPDYPAWALAVINDRFSRYYGENHVWKTEADYTDLQTSYVLYTEEQLSGKISHTLDKLVEKMRGHLVPKHKLAS